ncbi:related to SRP102 |uniref:Signal recognition particle receptor subunit beta n=1 Tax=Pseudozyma flocculosa TaxID=84751 RepID=A0A5C3F570_9BASI|nr:related to SRP102 \
MAFVAPALRWPDAALPYLPASLRDSTIPPQHLFLASATLAVLLVSFLLTRSPRQLESAHLAATTASSADKRSRGKQPTVILVGLSDSGKTALFSELVYGATPETLPSQRESQGLVEPARILQPGDAESVKPTVLVDLPGHPRLRPKVDEYINQADGIVICVDAMAATKPANARVDRDANDVAAVADLVHNTLTSLAKQRLRSNSSSTAALSAPSVLVLFTRSDLSTLLSAANADASKDLKRRQQLLTRCRTAVETELGQRRAGMGLGRRSAGVRIAGVGKVVDGEPSSLAPGDGIFGWIKRALGLGSSSSSRGPAADDVDTLDYVDWQAARREAVQAASQSGGGGGGGTQASNTFSLEKLDEEVVWGGKVKWGLASVGKARAWDKGESVPVDQDGLRELKRWLVSLQLD